MFLSNVENGENDLADFREWFDYLSQKCSEPTVCSVLFTCLVVFPLIHTHTYICTCIFSFCSSFSYNLQDMSNDVSNKGEGSRNKALQDEVWKLKSEIEKCKLEKNSEISALLAEKNFVWNQFKKMEEDFNIQLRKKSDEVEHANEKVRMLVNRAEELQMSNEKLRTDFTKMESESVQKNEEIFKLLKKIELLKSRSGSESPLLRPCRAEAVASSRGGKNRTNGSVVTVKKESDSSQTFEKVTVFLVL